MVEGCLVSLKESVIHDVDVKYYVCQEELDELERDNLLQTVVDIYIHYCTRFFFYKVLYGTL